MAQGLGKLKKTPGAQKRKTAAHKKKKQATITKGRKHYNPKGRKAEQQRPQVAISKAINRKNEALISAKAVSDGTKFALRDVSELGKTELQAQQKARTKKEDKATRLTDRLKDQLKKLGRDVDRK
jgi:hypothetical protein